MFELIMAHRRWLAALVMGVCIVGLFIRQEVSRLRRLRRMARECRHEARRRG